MAKYTTTQNIKYRGAYYGPGATVSIDDETAAGLVEAGVVVAAEKKAAVEKEPPAKDAPAKTGK